MAQYEEIIIDQGTDVAIEIRLINVNGSSKDLAGYNVFAQLRRTAATSDSDAINFTALVTDPASDGIVTLILTSGQTELLSPPRYFYDVKISYTDSDDQVSIERVLYGVINVNNSFTTVWNNNSIIKPTVVKSVTVGTSLGSIKVPGVTLAGLFDVDVNSDLSPNDILTWDLDTELWKNRNIGFFIDSDLTIINDRINDNDSDILELYNNDSGFNISLASIIATQNNHTSDISALYDNDSDQNIINEILEDYDSYLGDLIEFEESDRTAAIITERSLTATLTNKTLTAPIITSSASFSGLNETGAASGRTALRASIEFATRAEALAWRTAGGDIAVGLILRAGGVDYKRVSGATAISDLLGFLPAGNPRPNHFPGETTGAAITAAWAYFQTIMGTGAAADLAASGGLVFEFGGGLYNSGGSLITLTTAGFGQTIQGVGLASKLNNVNFVIADSSVNISKLQIYGLAKAADAITWTPRGTSIRNGAVSDVYISGARYGFRTINDANVGWIRLHRNVVTGCVKGIRFDRLIGITITECHLADNDEEGGVLYRGGELRMIGNRFRGNGKAGFRFDGSIATGRGHVVVENYIIACSFSGNYSNNANKKTHSILSAVSNGLGGTRFTVDVGGGRHFLTNGLIKVKITNTGVYDADWSIDNVTNNTFEIDATFAGTCTGLVLDPGFDLEIIGDASIRPSQTNDIFVADCNCNNVLIQDAVNINFDNGRQKVRVFLNENCYDIRRIATGRGRFKSTVDDEDSDEGIGSGTWKTISITGQNYGFVEDLSDMGTGWLDPKGMVRRVPDPTIALIGNNVQAYLSNQIDEDNGTTITGPLVLSSLINFANDSAAAAGLIPISGIYRTGSILKIRVV